jgi:hypothetical protein
MDRLKAPAIGAPGATPSTPPSTSLERTSPSLTAEAAKRAVNRLFAWCLMPQVHDAEVYLAGAVAILSEYPPAVMSTLADPATGTRVLKPYPSLHDLRRACDDLYAPIEREDERRQAHKSHIAGALPRPKRTPEQQARVDAQVAAARQQLAAAALPEQIDEASA